MTARQKIWLRDSNRRLMFVDGDELKSRGELCMSATRRDAINTFCHDGMVGLHSERGHLGKHTENVTVHEFVQHCVNGESQDGRTM